MSETPRTDKALFHGRLANQVTECGLMVWASFSADLERELSEARGLANRLRETNEALRAQMKKDLDSLLVAEQKIKELEAQVQGMRCCQNCAINPRAGSDPACIGCMCTADHPNWRMRGKQ